MFLLKIYLGILHRYNVKAWLNFQNTLERFNTSYLKIFPKEKQPFVCIETFHFKKNCLRSTIAGLTSAERRDFYDNKIREAGFYSLRALYDTWIRYCFLGHMFFCCCLSYRYYRIGLSKELYVSYLILLYIFRFMIYCANKLSCVRCLKSSYVQ